MHTTTAGDGAAGGTELPGGGRCGQDLLAVDEPKTSLQQATGVHFLYVAESFSLYFFGT